MAEIARRKGGQTELQLPADYLTRTGYRLPTEAEWEYTCRTGSVTSRYNGEAAELLPHYAWYLQNSHTRPWPVGQKKPNDFGLFDMHGNVWARCQDAYGDYPKAGADEVVEDGQDDDKVGLESRVLRGGAFDNHASVVRSASRDYERPAYRYSYVGLRPARTYR